MALEVPENGTEPAQGRELLECWSAGTLALGRREAGRDGCLLAPAAGWGLMLVGRSRQKESYFAAGHTRQWVH